MEDAKKYSIRKNWKRASPDAYRYAREKGFFNKATEHMKKVIRWNKASVAREAKKYNSISEWQKKSGGSYVFALKNKLVEKLIKRKEYVYYGKWTKKNIICLFQKEFTK